MSARILTPTFLTLDAFAPYGDVIEADSAPNVGMNDGAFDKFSDLARVDIAGEGGRPSVSIVRCREPATMPVPVRFVERHPLGSQAFIPLTGAHLLLVVAPAGDTVAVDDLKAFISNGRQGINYRPGIWHVPLIGLMRGQEVLIVDRGGPGMNCEEFHFDDDIRVTR